MTGYAHGFSGLAEYLGLRSRKTAQRLHERVKFPVARIPGVTRETLLFPLQGVDATLAKYKSATSDVDSVANAIAEAVVQAVGGTTRRGAR